MSTRTRAIAVTTLTSLLFFLNIIGFWANLFQLQSLPRPQQLLYEFGLAISVSALVLIGTLWTLYFKRKGLSWLAVGAFPAVAILPYILLSDSIVNALFGSLGQIPIAVITTVIFAFSIYFLLLTANALNGSILYKIPLGQVGKAAQFIFSLISSYFLLVYLFESAFPIVVRASMVFVFILFFAFSSIWVLQVSWKQTVYSSLTIAALMVLVVLLLSIWPIGAIYATVAAIVLLYILLNIALETREVINQELWLEYAVLITLVVVILLTNGEWGIHGTLI